MANPSLRQELSEILARVLDQVRYLEALGVSEVEDALLRSTAHQGRTTTAAARRLPLPQERMSAEATVTSEPPLRTSVVSPPLPEPPRVPLGDRPGAEEGSHTMPRRKSRLDTGAQQSLFGEAPTVADAPPTDHTLDDIRRDVGDCTRCKLCESRTTIVFGEGNPRARLMFVGEGPGADEDAQGRPFVGRAGQLLTRMIEAMGLRREDVYITNVVMCRPPGNRTPEPDEIATCEPFLFRKIRVIRPDVVVALGAIAAQSLLRTKAPISQVRGQFFDAHGTKVLPTFHPAFLLRSPEKKKEAWEDLKKVRDYLQRPRTS